MKELFVFLPDSVALGRLVHDVPGVVATRVGQEGKQGEQGPTPSISNCN